MFQLLVALPILLTSPQLLMKWSTVAKQSLSFFVTKQDTFMQECRESGSDVYYRYEYQLCKRRSAWLDGCGDFQNQTRTLSYDPISENYKIKYEKWGGHEPDTSSQFTTLEEAVSELSMVKSIPLEELIKVSGYEDIPTERLYVRANARFICKGERNTIMDRVSRIITLGLVRPGTTESGWIDFYLVER